MQTYKVTSQPENELDLALVRIPAGRYRVTRRGPAAGLYLMHGTTQCEFRTPSDTFEVPATTNHFWYAASDFDCEAIAGSADAVRCRIDGNMGGVNGPVWCNVDRQRIAGTMGWQDAGDAAQVIGGTLRLLQEGKAVRLKSALGTSYFCPLADGEHGLTISASRDRVHDWRGEIVEQVV